jgi:hypothetical protein
MDAHAREIVAAKGRDGEGRDGEGREEGGRKEEGASRRRREKKELRCERKEVLKAARAFTSLRTLICCKVLSNLPAYYKSLRKIRPFMTYSISLFLYARSMAFQVVVSDTNTRY